ncbi:alpha/beta hydrolase family protein [Natranaerovirga hydrolytica]|uniref:Alpha/beta hydrolase family protein n=1 Tax=Natranaerovirga hydrolytica TaxID=680378 RepID=A0A4R1MZM5_9FIRM|nr:alpha/beta hydrolase family protein [Natranaerovirga hydrolytica]TCK98070.1 alpha/beta hydrolase family protein [Natranaerovirga hydrolytica]
MWTPNGYIENLYKSIHIKYQFNATTQGEWQSWHNDLRSQLKKLLGDFPKVNEDFQAVELESKEFDTYIRKKVEITTFKNLRVPAYILTPQNKPSNAPAILTCVGHGHGYKEAIGLLPSEESNQPSLHKNFAIQLVNKGFIVMVPEVLGFGDRRLEEDMDKSSNENSCYRLATQLLMTGKTLAGHRVYEAIRFIDYLIEHENVNSDRIGCMGFSGGGLVAGLTAALDDRIKATVISCYNNTFKDSIMAMRHCLDNYIPNILNYCEMSDIISLIAPRHLFIESGIHDDIFPVEGSKASIKNIQKAYDVLGLRNHLQVHLFDGKHEICGIQAYPWLEKRI